MKLKLRKFKKEDEKSLQENVNDKEIYKNTERIPNPYTMKDARLWIKKCVREDKKMKPEMIVFCIDIGGEVAGAIDLHNIDWKGKNAEIGYWLAKKYWSKGIMTRALRKLLKIGFNQKKFVRIYAYTMEKNKTSQRVLEKAGFKLEGKLRKHLLKDGKCLDSRIYAKVK